MVSPEWFDATFGLTSSSIGEKDTTRVAAGLRAAIHNPNVSEEAKERAADRLDNLGERSGGIAQGGADTNRVLGGYKATLAVRF